MKEKRYQRNAVSVYSFKHGRKVLIGESRVLREQFPRLKSRLPTLWSRSYYGGSMGTVCEENVRAYIDNQKRS